jgi:hypothetical protein
MLLFAASASVLPLLLADWMDSELVSGCGGEMCDKTTTKAAASHQGFLSL